MTEEAAQQDGKNQALREDPKHAVGRAGESRFSKWSMMLEFFLFFLFECWAA